MQVVKTPKVISAVSIFSYIAEIFKKLEGFIFAVKHSNITYMTYTLFKKNFAAKISEHFVLSNINMLYILVVYVACYSPDVNDLSDSFALSASLVELLMHMTMIVHLLII